MNNQNKCENCTNKKPYQAFCMLPECNKLVTSLNDNGYYFPGCSEEHIKIFRNGLAKCMMPGCHERRWFNHESRTICYHCEKHLKHSMPYY